MAKIDRYIRQAMKLKDWDNSGWAELWQTIRTDYGLTDKQLDWLEGHLGDYYNERSNDNE